MATNTLLTPTMIAREALRLLRNNMVMGARVYRGYESEFPGSPKKGGTVQIRKPVKFKVTKSRVRTSTPITEQYITLNVATQAHVSWAFESHELTMSIEEYSDRYIRPAAAVLANQVDQDLCGLYADVWNWVNETSEWVDPHTFMVLAKSQQRLDEEAAPSDERCVVLNPAGHWAMANALAGLYAPTVAEKAIRKGYLGTVAGADIYMDQNIKTHTVGNWATDTAAASSASRYKVHTTADSAAGGGLPSGAVVGVSQNQAIYFDGYNKATTVAQFLTGDVFTIAGCYAVNPMSGESTGVLRQFVVTADAYQAVTASTIEGYIKVYFQPDMIHTGAYKTVDTIPQLEAAVQVFGRPATNLPMNLAFHKNAFALVMVPLEVPQGTPFASTVSDEGFSIRVVKSYDIDNDADTIRLDILYGVKTIYPELACRISGALAGGT